jgi:carbamoyl-phosphate synthase large subunit
LKTVLVSGASGIVGYGILKSLRQAGTDYRLIGSTIYGDSVAPAFCDVFERAPLTKDENYIAWLCGTIAKHEVDLLIPGIEADMFKWNQERDLLEKSGTKLLLNSADLIQLCSDKWHFYEKLQRAGSNLVIESTLSGSFQSLKERFGLPFLLKPRKSYGSKGIVIVDSEKTFLEHQANLGPVVMAQPIVGDDHSEYTISAFFDRQSKLCCLIGLRRRLAKEGFTEKAAVALPPYAEESITELSDHLKPVGPTNFQFRVHNGRLRLLEINPRISSATSIRAAFGYNESVMSVEYFLAGKLPDQPAIRPGYAVRYIEEQIFYDSPNI